MAKTISYEIEKFDSPEENFYTVTLTGDTYAAREIIQGLGDFHFSSPVGREKAWRSDPMKESELAAKREAVRNIVTKMYNALKGAGYTVVRH